MKALKRQIAVDAKDALNFIVAVDSLARFPQSDSQCDNGTKMIPPKVGDVYASAQGDLGTGIVDSCSKHWGLDERLPQSGNSAPELEILKVEDHFNEKCWKHVPKLENYFLNGYAFQQIFSNF